MSVHQDRWEKGIAMVKNKNIKIFRPGQKQTRKVLQLCLATNFFAFCLLGSFLYKSLGSINNPEKFLVVFFFWLFLFVSYSLIFLFWRISFEYILSDEALTLRRPYFADKTIYFKHVKMTEICKVKNKIWYILLSSGYRKINFFYVSDIKNVAQNLKQRLPPDAVVEEKELGEWRFYLINIMPSFYALLGIMILIVCIFYWWQLKKIWSSS